MAGTENRVTSKVSSMQVTARMIDFLNRLNEALNLLTPEELIAIGQRIEPIQ